MPNDLVGAVVQALERQRSGAASGSTIPPVVQTTEPTRVIPPVVQTTEPTRVIPPVVQTAEPTRVIPPVAQTTEPTRVIPPVVQTTEPTRVIPPVVQTAEPTRVIPPVAQTTEPTRVIPPVAQTTEPTRVIPPVVQTTEPTRGNFNAGKRVSPIRDPGHDSLIKARYASTVLRVAQSMEQQTAARLVSGLSRDLPRRTERAEIAELHFRAIKSFSELATALSSEPASRREHLWKGAMDAAAAWLKAVT